MVAIHKPDVGLWNTDEDRGVLGRIDSGGIGECALLFTMRSFGGWSPKIFSDRVPLPRSYEKPRKSIG